jgi:hypothetical protein
MDKVDSLMGIIGSSVIIFSTSVYLIRYYSKFRNNDNFIQGTVMESNKLDFDHPVKYNFQITVEFKENNDISKVTSKVLAGQALKKGDNVLVLLSKDRDKIEYIKKYGATANYILIFEWVIFFVGIFWFLFFLSKIW